MDPGGERGREGKPVHGPPPEVEPGASRGRVLLVDDEWTACEVAAAGLKRRGFEVEWRTSAEEAFVLFAGSDFDAVVTDIRMPGTSGIALCERIAANRPDVPVILITAFGSLDTAVAAMRAGAYDFVTKPFDVDALALRLDRAIERRALRAEVKRLRRVAADAQRFDELVGASAPMRALFDVLERAAPADGTVLITGETGTGKELVARALHRRGRRAAGPFLAVSCAALPERLLESELFGHARGALPEARAARVGLFVRASGGTLLLDEVADLPLALQPKLLRALEERKVRPIGSDEEVPFDARIVATTARDIEAAVEDGRFREELYFRLNVIQVAVPPLRARGGDILLLAQAFVVRFAARAGKAVRGLSSAAAERLQAYDWPGNVRELQNCIEQAVALARAEEIAVDDLPEKIRRYEHSHVVVAGHDPTELIPLEEVERRYVLRVLEAAGGNKAHAARVLGLDRTTLYRKLQRYDTRGVGRPGEEGK